MHAPFKFEEQLKLHSPLLYQWSLDNSVFLFDFDECMFAKNAEALIVETITEATQNYKVIAICESHPFMLTDEIYVEKHELVKKVVMSLNLPIIFLTADYRLLDNNTSNRIFFPGWYFRQRYWANKHNYNEYPWPTTRKYNFSCCSMANYRTEKVYNYIECFKRQRDDWYITMYDHGHARITEKSIREIGGLTDEQMQMWDTKIKHTIPMYKYDLLNGERLNPHSAIFLGHTEAYCNLVMEHSMEIEILSEKSFKPFLANQIPIYCASLGAAAALTKLGFDLFYDFVDHNEYDNISINDYRDPQNFTERILAIHNLIDELYKTDFTKFFHDSSVQLRLSNNKEHFYSNNIDHMCIQQLNGILNK
jgi:hypothetical protein